LKIELNFIREKEVKNVSTSPCNKYEFILKPFTIIAELVQQKVLTHLLASFSTAKIIILLAK